MADKRVGVPAGPPPSAAALAVPAARPLLIMETAVIFLPGLEIPLLPAVITTADTARAGTKIVMIL